MSKSNEKNRLPGPLVDLIIKKFDKKDVDFELKASGMDCCNSCKYFAQGAGCYIVKGLIKPTSWCNKFEQDKIKGDLCTQSEANTTTH